MPTRTYDGTYPDSDITTEHEAERRAYTDVGANIFIWIAWAIAFAFWAFSMQEAFGIIDAIMTTPAGVVGGVDFGGIEFAVISIAAVVALGLAIAYGAVRWAGRDRSLDPVTEAATAKLYDEGARPRA